MVNSIAKHQYHILQYCTQNYKPNTLAPHGPPDASQTVALDNDLV